jgi:predicted alpha-1,2-mannosidase
MADDLLRYTSSDSPLARVNPLQGTHSHFGFSTGNTLPLIARPFGMTHWSPQTNEQRGGWFFHPADRKLEGIRATHQPSPWIGDYGHFTVMPQTGLLRPGAAERASGYRPEDATFLPHLFCAHLLQYDTSLEFTPTERCALLRCRFHADTAVDPIGAALPPRLLFEPGRGEGYVELLPGERKLRGWTRANSGGVPANFALHFVACFDTELTGCGVFQGRNALPGEPQRGGERPGAFVEFAPSPSPAERATVVEARIATSFISWEQAERNLQQEIGNHSFEAMYEQAAAAWEAALGRLEIEGGSDAERRIFASCLYRTQLFPRDFHEIDADGNARHFSPYDGQAHDGPLVTDNGFWDTYRTVYPLFSLLDPDRLSHILQGWISAYRESGWFPTWASPGHRTCMVGTHADAVFADAVVKGISGFDLKTAYDGLRKHAFEVVTEDTGFGRLGLADYLERGYVPDDRVHHASASRTLDYAYDDFCIAQVARALGRADEADKLLQRAGNWRHVYDPSVGVMRGRNADGSWREPWDPFEWGGPFVEGGPWQHAWGVPHDPAGLIAAMGGPEAFVEKLEQMLTAPPRFRVGSYGFEIHEMTEMACAGFGQYAHSNQPVHHVLSLFACAGRPDRAQYWVRRVLAEQYSPDRFAGDEDNGEMSAWYILSALGLYPLCPGHPTYVLGSPLFPAAHLSLPGGHRLTIRAVVEGSRPLSDCPYVQSVTWNGQPWTRLWIAHADLVRGGELCFRMSDTPPAPRSFTPDELPFSLTSAEPSVTAV